MIGMLRGRVVAISSEMVVVDVGGVGYEVACHGTCLAAIADGRDHELMIHTQVSDDDIRLFGFQTRDEKSLFRQLIRIDRVGPKVALAILGMVPLRDLVIAIERGDVQLLESAPGVGKRTAERIVLELKGKVNAPAPSDPGETPSGAVQQAFAILVDMGFGEHEVRRILGTVDGDKRATLEAIVHTALKRFGQEATKPTRPGSRAR